MASQINTSHIKPLWCHEKMFFYYLDNHMYDT